MSFALLCFSSFVGSTIDSNKHLTSVVPKSSVSTSVSVASRRATTAETATSVRDATAFTPAKLFINEPLEVRESIAINEIGAIEICQQREFVNVEQQWQPNAPAAMENLNRVSCFMISTLQCLASLPALANWCANR